jgi:hypothetical protein
VFRIPSNKENGMTAPTVNHPCDVCGALDDHPMIHVGWTNWQKDDRTSVSEPSFHFDCLPAEFVSMLGDDPSHNVTLAAIDAAKSGTNGAALREFIAAQETDNLTPEG